MDEKPKRTRHGRAFWLGHILACERAGNVVDVYTQEHGLSEQSFCRWKRVLSQSGELSMPQAAPMFQRLELVSASVPVDEELPPERDETRGVEGVTSLEAIASCRIRLPNGTALEVSGALSAGLIGQLLQVAGALPLVAGGTVR